MKREPDRPRALLINPPIYDFALFDLFLKPYGLFRIGAALHEAGYEIDYINGPGFIPAGANPPRRKTNGTGKFFRTPVELPEILQKHLPADFQRSFARYGISPAELEERIRETKPDIVFLATSMTYWYSGAGEAGQLVRKIFPRVPLIAGGIYASLMGDHCRRSTGADEVCSSLDRSGLNRILARAGLPTVPGTGPLGPPLTQRRYWGESAVLRLNEGCPFKCDYCSSGSLSPRFLSGNPVELFRQFEKLTLTGISNFAFYDDALLVQKEQTLIPFLEQVAASPYRPAFYTPNAVHLSLLDLRTAELMRRAGFREIQLGYESSSEDFHADHGQKYSRQSFPEAVRVLKEAGYGSGEIGVYILAGLPGQAAAEVIDSVAEAGKAGVRVAIAEYSPVPGSPLWKECSEHSSLPLEEEPLFHNNTFFPMAWAGFSRTDLERVKAVVRAANQRLPQGSTLAGR